jgi:putative hydrolase of the HAD superfamily
MCTLEEIPAKLIWQNYVLPDYPEVHPLLEPVADDLMVWIETHYYHRQMRPEIPAVLKAIQEMGYKIGLISNVASRGQVPFNLKQYGIVQYFNPIVLSSEYGRRKPDPAIFHYAARLSNTATSECIYIGDRIARDIVGAKRAGFKLAIQIRHDFNHGESDDGAVPDFIVNNMYELLELLKREYRDCLQETKGTKVSRKIKAVLFDADGVLYYRKNKDQELAPFIKQHGIPCPDNIEPEIAKLRRQAFVGQMSFEQYKAGVLNLYGITDPALVAEGVATAIREKEQVFFWNDTLETLKLIKARGLYLGIITDTAHPLHFKLSKLECGGIGNLWDSIIPSSEVGVQKPDPAIYRLALAQLGIEADQAVFVGHKSSELEGAHNSGITTVAYNYEPGARADIYIKQFSDLSHLDILK